MCEHDHAEQIRTWILLTLLVVKGTFETSKSPFCYQAPTICDSRPLLLSIWYCQLLTKKPLGEEQPNGLRIPREFWFGGKLPVVTSETEMRNSIRQFKRKAPRITKRKCFTMPNGAGYR